MAYDEGLAARVRLALDDEMAISEKKMFGGLAIMLGGNMAVGVSGEELMVRVDPAEQAAVMREPGVRAFTMSGRPTKGFILVSAENCAEDDDLRRWIARGVGYAASLPPK